MRTKRLNPHKVNIVTLGCSKNLYDSEQIFTQLKGNSFEVTHEDTKGDAGIVIINTCGFIDNAKQESIDTILRYADAKTEGLVDKVYVTGCLSQRYSQELSAEIPNVDAWFGTSDLPRLLKTLKADYKKELVGERLITTPSHYAYLKIAEGCDRPCSFCAIPLMRGKHVSFPEEDLVYQAQKLAEKGVRELILIAQDLTYYGLDIYGGRTLPKLLEKLSDVQGIDWIRLQYAYPAGFPTDILKVMAERPNICNYLDIPLQHGSDNMLKKMRRGITREKTEKLLDTIRTMVPGIAVRTTMIVGHPGETDQDFAELMEFVQWAKFERLGAFTYSHEEQTHSHSFEDDVPEEVKEERAALLMEVQQGISEEINQKRVGTGLNVLLDRRENGFWIGRTEFDSPEVDNEVLIPVDLMPIETRSGQMIAAKITSAEAFDLYGVPVTGQLF